MRRREHQSGFGTVEILLVVLVVAALAATGLVVYQRHKTNNAKDRAAANQTQTTTQPQNTTSTQPAQPDVYANWKTYCDSIYRYCFKYPQDWTFSANTAAKLGDTGGATLSNPANTIQVVYTNAYTQDSGVQSFMPISLDKPTAANQDLTIVGGYIPTSGDNGLAGNNIPGYKVVDTSLLNKYPLTVGTESQFPTNPSFTDKNTGTLSRQGEFKVKPSVTINSLDETHAWFSNSDVKTSLLILKSFYFKPNP